MSGVRYEDRLSAEKASELLRADVKEERKVVETGETRGPVVQMEEGTLPVDIEMHVDRKSVFVGRACRITDANQALYRHTLTS